MNLESLRSAGLDASCASRIAVGELTPNASASAGVTTGAAACSPAAENRLPRFCRQEPASH
jgi:hypothetical protein